MSNNFDEEYIVKFIKEELKKYISNENLNKINKETLEILGKDENLEKELEQEFEIKSNAETLVVAKMSLKNLYNISIGVYTDEYEEKMLKYILESKKVVLLEEALEYKQYGNIPSSLLKKYEKYLEDIKSFGVFYSNKENFLKHITNNEEVYSSKLLSLKKIEEYCSSGMKKIVILKNTIVTSSAAEYAKDEGIEIVRRS